MNCMVDFVIGESNEPLNNNSEKVEELKKYSEKSLKNEFNIVEPANLNGTVDLTKEGKVSHD